MDVITLIQLVKCHPSIWNTSSIDYRNRIKRNKSYIEIAKYLNMCVLNNGLNMGIFTLSSK